MTPSAWWTSARRIIFIKTCRWRRWRPASTSPARSPWPGRWTTTAKCGVDDCVLFLARFASGAVASFEATRLATGNQNKNGLEINGDKGSIMFNFEDMNYLSFYDATLPRKQQGWTKIMVTHAGDHPYAANWWPDAHIIGYEHGFINQVADIMNMIAGKPPVVPMPDFEDAYKTQQVLEAALISAQNRSAVKIS